jgi:cell division protein FtsQ
MFRSRRNRRKVDLARKTSEVKASVKSLAPAVLKALAVTAASTGLVFGGLRGWQWATTTDTFAMKRVRVVGSSRVTESQVTRLGGLVVGANLVALDLSAVERAVGTHPWVRSVSVNRQLPDTVVVQLVEHQPVALLALSDLYLVDGEGEPFKRAQANEAMDLPLVTGIGREALVNKRDETRAVIRRALIAIDAYGRSAASKGHPVSEVNVGPDQGLTLVTATGEEIVLGEADLEPALERLARVRRELAARQLTAEVIRLDNRTRPDWVAVRTSGPGSGRSP